MNQMEHNVKIKNYNAVAEPNTFIDYSRSLVNAPVFQNNLEQQRMLERFQQLHWKTEKINNLRTHSEKMFTIRQEQNILLDDQRRERADVEEHRLAHLESIKDNIKKSRETFYRRTQLERPGAVDRQLGTGPLYKIVNDGKPIRF